MSTRTRVRCLILSLILGNTSYALNSCYEHLAITPISEDLSYLYALSPKPINLSEIKRSHLSTSEVENILGTEEPHFPYLMGKVYGYMTQLEWNPEIDQPHYTDFLEKKMLIARDLLHQMHVRDDSFHFIQGLFPNGDIYFLGSAGHFIYLRAKNQKLYKGYLPGDITDEAVLKARKIALKHRFNEERDEN